MKQTIKTIGWFFFALDSIALLFVLHWALTASTREGESAYAIVLLLFMLVLVGVGGAALARSAQRGSNLVLCLATLLLGLPPALVVILRIINSL